MIVVVSDTSPIRALHHLGLLSLLGELYDEVYVPPKVRSELEKSSAQFEAIDLTRHDFIRLRAPLDLSRVNDFRRKVDAAESEALALAVEIGAKALLIDEKAGRALAKQHGVLTIGTLGLLLQAKANQKIEFVRPLVEELIADLNFFVSEDLLRRVYQLARE